MPSAAISLPVERADQLRTLAAARGLTVADLIGELLASEIKAGRLSAAVPGFDVRAVDGVPLYQLHIEPGLTITRLNSENLTRIADAIEVTAAGAGAPARLANYGPVRIDISRNGRGVRINARNSATGAAIKRTMSKSVALDLARQLRNAT